MEFSPPDTARDGDSAGPWSYASAPSQEPWVYQTFPDRLSHWASKCPDKEAFVFYGMDKKRTAINCRELLEKSRAFGRQLVKSGLKKGDMVCFCMSNSMNMVIANMGAMLAGGVPFYTPTNMADGSDIIAILKETDACVLLIDASVYGQNWSIVENIISKRSELSLRNIICNGINDGATRPVTFLNAGFQRYEGEADIVFPVIYPEDIAVYYKTSGTTGKPKLVGLTHVTLLNSAIRVNKSFDMDTDSIYFCDRPFSWAIGWPRTYFSMGSTRIFLDIRLTVSAGYTEFICDVISQERCSHLYLPRYLVTDILQRPDLVPRFSAVKTVICAGERLPASSTRLLDGYCQYLCSWYGSTEVCGVSMFQHSDPGRFEPGIIGTPTEGVEMKLVDSAGHVIRKGATGELLTRSVTRFSEYRNMVSVFQATVDRDGWYHSGDICHVREDGNFVMEGRYSDQISMGTMKYFPWEVESVLVTCPGIKAAAAVPVPDIRLNQVICACVIVNPASDIDEGHVKAFCDVTWVDTTTAAGFSLKPRHVIAFSHFPLNASGKLDRKRLTQLARSKLKL